MSLTRFGAGDIVVSTDSLVTSTWSGNLNNLQGGYTGSTTYMDSPTSSGWFHLDVYQTSSTDSTAEVQYSISYGNRLGSGSPDFTNDSGSHGMTAARVTYGAYRNLVFGDETQNFTFDTHVPVDIYVINVARARYKQTLKPGTLNLTLSSSMRSSPDKYHNFQLTDDSVTQNGSAKLTNLGRQFNIVSGSSGIRASESDPTVAEHGTTIGQVAGSSSYGLFYPDAGVIILNPDNFGSGSTTFSGLGPSRWRGEMTNFNGVGKIRNPEQLFNAISKSEAGFIVDSQEKITSQYYFARAKNFEYNYTTNPSFTDSSGNLTYSSMINNPVTYITTVGLYNDENDLVAVAKLSQPVVKDFTKEALIRVKLDY